MQVAIRVDDIGWLPHKGMDAGLKLAQCFHEAMAGLSYLGAIIPKAIDSEGLAWLQSRPGGLIIAMHGLTHAQSEFRGLSVGACRLNLESGKILLEGIALCDLVLPFNSWEPVLEEACYSEDITRVWGGQNHLESDPSRWTTPPTPYPLGNLTFIPSWKPLYGAVLWPSGTHERALCETMPEIMERPGRAVLTLHLTWEAARGNDFAGVRRFVERYGDLVISPQEYIQ